MAFEDVEIGEEPFSPYWKPNSVGENIEGNVYDFEQGDYGKQILLYRGEDGGDLLITTLPAHRNLMRYYENLGIGDYIRVTVTDIKPPAKDDGYPMNIYKVEKDADRFVEFDE